MNGREREIKYIKEMKISVLEDLLWIEELQELYYTLKEKEIDYEHLRSLTICPHCYVGLCQEENKLNKCLEINVSSCLECWKTALK